MEEMMTKVTSRVSRRSALKGIGAAGVAATSSGVDQPL
jgi:hypothetical protein